MALLPDNKNPKPVQQAAPQPKRKGTGFTNLQRILQASQGSKLGQTIKHNKFNLVFNPLKNNLKKKLKLKGLGQKKTLNEQKM